MSEHVARGGGGEHLLARGEGLLREIFGSALVVYGVRIFGRHFFLFDFIESTLGDGNIWGGLVGTDYWGKFLQRGVGAPTCQGGNCVVLCVKH